MTEKEFVEFIDCNFPYEDEEKSKALIMQANQISINSSFMVLHEIVRSPLGIPQKTLIDLYELWLDGMSYKLLPAVCEAAEAMLAGQEVSVDRALELMGKFTTEKGQYNAINIIYFSCDDQDGLVDKLYREIIQRWKSS